jgi:hypothetical protein
MHINMSLLCASGELGVSAYSCSYVGYLIYYSMRLGLLVTVALTGQLLSDITSTYSKLKHGIDGVKAFGYGLFGSTISDSLPWPLQFYCKFRVCDFRVCDLIKRAASRVRMCV